jgi:hypothetical protein
MKSSIPFQPKSQSSKASSKMSSKMSSKVLLLLILSTMLFSCKELEKALSQDCTQTKKDYQAAISKEGELATTIKEDGPFPMALIFSQDSVNQMFAAVADNDIDPITVPLGSLGAIFGVGGFDVDLVVDPDLPLIQFESVADCETCISLEMSFGLAFKIEGESVGGAGTAKCHFPLALKSEAFEYTSFIGEFNNAVCTKIDIDVTGSLDVGIPGLDISVNELIDLAEPAVEDVVNGVLQNDFSETELFKLESWKIGKGDVRLLARGPILNAEQKTLTLGIHTNLVRPLDETVALEPSLPEGADVGMQFHPELVQAMIQRMLSEGTMSRSYDESGNKASSGGLFEVSFTTLEQSELEPGLLTAGFTVWRTDGFLCGSSEFLVDLGVSISDGNIALEAKNLRAGNTTGAFGQLVSTIENWIGGQFIDDMINISQLTFNYRELNLPNNKKASMSAETFRLEIGGNGFNIFLNLDQIL